MKPRERKKSASRDQGSELEAASYLSAKREPTRESSSGNDWNLFPLDLDSLRVILAWTSSFRITFGGYSGAISRVYEEINMF